MAVAVVLPFLLRAPLIDELPANWDAAQLALGITDFNLSAHQPHPPGYILFVAGGALLNGVTGSPSTALGWFANLAAALTTLPLYVLARSIANRPIAAVAVALSVSGPLTWYYGSVGLTYSADGFFTVLVVAALWASRRYPGWLILAAAALALAGGFRPWTLVFLLPAFALSARRARLRVATLAVATLIMVCALWAVPLVLLSGGLENYLAESRALGTAQVYATSILGGPIAALDNVVNLALGLLLAMHVTVAVGAGMMLVRWQGADPDFAKVPAGGPLARFLRLAQPPGWSSDAVTLLVAAAAPSLAFYALVHFGQPGYLLGPLQFLNIAAAAYLWRFCQLLSAEVKARPATLATIATSIGALAGIGLFFAPATGLSLPALANERDSWRELRAVIQQLPADQTVLLADFRALGSFRTLSYYFPMMTTIAVGKDLHGDTGEIFRVVGGRSNHRPARAADIHATPLALSSDDATIVIVDETVWQLLEPSARFEEHTLATGRRYWLRGIGPFTSR